MPGRRSRIRGGAAPAGIYSRMDPCRVLPPLSLIGAGRPPGRARRHGWKAVGLLVLLSWVLLSAGCARTTEVTLAYTGSADGVIWPCYGCAWEPTGGLARRATALAQLRDERPDLLLVDSGDLLSARGRPIGDRKVLEVYRLLGYDAVNVGDQEFINGAEFFRTEVLGAGLPLLSASLQDEETGKLLLHPYVIREVSGVRVALLGLVDTQAFMVLKPELHRGIQVASLSEAVRRFLPELRDRADLLVVLSNLGSEGDRDLAEEVPEIDVIVGGHSGAAVAEPVKVGRTLIVRPGPGGKLIGRLDLALDASRQIVRHSHTLISLDESIPDDPAVAAAVAGVAVWEAGSQKEMMPSIQTGRLFTEGERCAGCHPRATEIWLQHGHARAYDTVPPERRGNLGCLPCHATGWAKGGYIDEARTPDLKHVGCTSCHEMRRKHLSWPERSPVPDVVPADCRRCHTDEWTPDFDYRSYWTRIAH